MEKLVPVKKTLHKLLDALIILFVLGVFFFSLYKILDYIGVLPRFFN
jgi:hypothetical protein